MIAYMVGPSLERAVVEGRARGWKELAVGRFATEARDEVRVITRAADLLPFAGDPTPLIRAGDYEDGPEVSGPVTVQEEQRAAWERARGEFEAFVASGRGRWVDAP